jgi:hypothetical protein
MSYRYPNKDRKQKSSHREFKEVEGRESKKCSLKVHSETIEKGRNVHLMRLEMIKVKRCTFSETAKSFGIFWRFFHPRNRNLPASGFTNSGIVCSEVVGEFSQFAISFDN